MKDLIAGLTPLAAGFALAVLLHRAERHPETAAAPR